MNELQTKFHNEMDINIKRFRATKKRTLQFPKIEMMLNDYKNYFKVAEQLIKEKNPTSGFRELLKEGLLEYSFESVACKKEYRNLFESNDIEVCEFKLTNPKLF